MTSFINLRWSLALGSLLLAWLVIIFVASFQLTGTRQTLPLSPNSIRHDSGCAYVVPLNDRPFGWPITDIVEDNSDSPKASSLVLLENGKPFGQAHALHSEIRQESLGKYSHWNQSLLFSLRNCNDPRVSNNTYEVSVPLVLSKWTKISWFASLLLITILFIKRFPSAAHSIALKIFEVSLYHSNSRQFSHILVFLLVFIFALASCFFAWIWWTGKTVDLAVGGFYQVSDALAYWTCANSLLDMGHFGNASSFTAEWCQRRAIYPNLLSGFTWIAQRNIFLTLLLQATVVCLSIFAVLRQSSPHIGVVGIAVGAALLVKYATDSLFMVTMTENAGVIFGCIGLAALFKSIENKSLVWASAGIAAFSIALNARAGAFFILPFLVLWAGIFAYSLNRNILVWIIIPTLAAVAGFTLQAALVIAVGGNPGNSHGNFSYVLYGLSAGGTGWQQVLVDHPELSGTDALMSKAIYALAWDNIQSNPRLLFQGLFKNLALFVSSGTYGFERLGVWAGVTKLCWWLAWIPLLSGFRKPAYVLIAFASLGVLASAPFLMVDGGSRVFAASVAVDVVQIGLGCYWIVFIVRRISRMEQRTLSINTPIESAYVVKTFLSIEGVLTIFVLAMLLVPRAQPLYSALPGFSINDKCKTDEYKVITFLGNRSSQVLSLVEGVRSPLVMKGEMARESFVKGIPISSWYRDQVIAFRGSTLLTAYQLDHSDPSAPGPYLAISDTSLSQDYYGRLVRLCIDRSATQIVFDTTYRRLNSIVVLD